MNSSVLVLRDVTVRYEPSGPSVIAGVSLSVATGERVALLGLNGSGKTTLLTAVVGLVPHQGEISVCGVELSRPTLPEVRSRVGFVFNVPEDQLLFPKVLEDVELALLQRKTPAAEAHAKARAMLDSLGVGHLAGSSVHHLSHGQKQRIALAGALVAEPPLLLLDEPSAGLDPPGKRSLARLLRSQSAAMVVATHDIDFAERFCTRFIMVEGGRVTYDGPDATAALRRWDEDDDPAGPTTV
jgi:cobalt/nickel transport system ATP-binding protein